MAEEAEINNTRVESYVIPQLSVDNAEMHVACPINRPAEGQNVEEGQTNTTDEMELIYGAKHVIMIFTPVTICMALVVLTISSIQYYTIDDGNYLLYTPFHPDKDDTSRDTILKSTLNALIVLAVVVFMTFLLIILYKLRCYKCMHGWIMLSSLMLLFIFAFIYMQELFKAFNVAMDMISVVLFLYNFGVTGMFMIHWHGPLRLQQAYLIISAGLMSLVFIKYMPEWTLWTVLGVLAIWDLVAVLAPHGPLKMLLETAEERGEAVMPALVYSSTVIYSILGAKKASQKNNKARTSNKPPKEAEMEIEKKQSPSAQLLEQTEENNKNPMDGADNEVAKKETSEVVNELTSEVVKAETSEEGMTDTMPQTGPGAEQRRRSFRGHSNSEEKGVKLGLGDFIFYSVLVGKASSAGNPITTIACFTSILMGLFLTLTILVTVKKALPALPISIMLGLIFNFGTEYAISPMISAFAANQAFL